jgi:hypothetical protein
LRTAVNREVSGSTPLLDGYRLLFWHSPGLIKHRRLGRLCWEGFSRKNLNVISLPGCGNPVMTIKPQYLEQRCSLTPPRRWKLLNHSTSTGRSNMLTASFFVRKALWHSIRSAHMSVQAVPTSLQTTLFHCLSKLPSNAYAHDSK